MTNLRCCCGLPMITRLSDESKAVHKSADYFTHAFARPSLDCTYEMTTTTLGGYRREGYQGRIKLPNTSSLASRGLREVVMLACGEWTGSLKQDGQSYPSSAASADKLAPKDSPVFG